MENGPMVFRCLAHERDPQGWEWRREVYLLRIEGRVREVVARAVEGFREQYGRAPRYVWVREVPRGAEDMMDVGDGMILIRAGWVPEEFVAVGI